MKIDRKLNLVIPVERDDGSTLHVFASPIAREVFQFYARVISKTFARMALDNVGYFGGPRICHLILQDVARTTLRAEDRLGQNWWDGPDGVEQGLMPEIRRLANVLTLSPNGWQTLPYEDALKQNLLTEDDVSEVEGAMCFFTVNFSMHKRRMGHAILEAAAGMWQLEITSSTLSDYKNSLKTSIMAADTGKREAASSTP